MLGLENLDGWKLLVVALIGIFVIGPDRLPKAIAEGVRMLRNLRNMARNATSDLSRELGTEITLEDLNPKSLLRKHILSEDDERTLRRPLESLYREVQDDVKGLRSEVGSVTEAVNAPATGTPKPAPASANGRRAIDLDAT
jgi:sec-independent protein translocase protein TatB